MKRVNEIKQESHGYYWVNEIRYLTITAKLTQVTFSNYRGSIL